jgi:hypothetical protein
MASINYDLCILCEVICIIMSDKPYTVMTSGLFKNKKDSKGSRMKSNGGRGVDKAYAKILPKIDSDVVDEFGTKVSLLRKNKDIIPEFQMVNLSSVHRIAMMSLQHRGKDATFVHKAWYSKYESTPSDLVSSSYMDDLRIRAEKVGKPVSQIYEIKKARFSRFLKDKKEWESRLYTEFFRTSSSEDVSSIMKMLSEEPSSSAAKDK